MIDPHQLSEADRDLTEAIETYLSRVGLGGTPGLTMTDILLVTVRRGFDTEGSKSATSVLVPTESSAVPTLIGMARYASLHFEKMAADTFPSRGDQ